MRALAILTMLISTAAVTPAEPLVEGNRESAVRVLIYEDLQCPDCAAFRKMLDDRLLPRYAGKVAFEHRDFPLAKHAWARKAAIAARFFQAASPELALAYRRQMMATIKETTPANFNDKLAAFAKGHGIDPQKALAALEDKKCADAVEEDFQDGVARGVSKTPTAFVNGQPFIETFTFEEISKAIDGALAQSR